MLKGGGTGSWDLVAPFTGAWIEISLFFTALTIGYDVAPFTGAWIEIHFATFYPNLGMSRSLHGGVD